ncbi:MAG: hypothetical protein HY917_04490 [Candidatus Diapherotrites archaeon]|nr:hypothetical protein [Candidatus Diapherotrites archaeon]
MPERRNPFLNEGIRRAHDRLKRNLSQWRVEPKTTTIIDYPPGGKQIRMVSRIPGEKQKRYVKHAISELIREDERKEWLSDCTLLEKTTKPENFHNTYFLKKKTGEPLLIGDFLETLLKTKYTRLSLQSPIKSLRKMTSSAT